MIRLAATVRTLSRGTRFVLVGSLLAASLSATAQDLLIRHATVHTASAVGTLRDTDVWVRNGSIAAIGRGLLAPADVPSIDAAGRPLTPGLFAGVTGIGIDEVSAEPSTHDTAITFGATPPQVAQMRPEFDVTLAYNPRSLLLPIARIEGVLLLLRSYSEGPELPRATSRRPHLSNLVVIGFDSTDKVVDLGSGAARATRETLTQGFGQHRVDQ